MASVFDIADSLGPAKVVHVHQPGIGLCGILVVDNVAIGPSIGGLRMAVDVNLEECFRLARAMSFKNAAAGLRHGGGKSVLVGDPRMPAERKQELVRTFAHALRNEQDYIFGPDMGTDETAMAWVKDEIGRAVGLPRELGGIPLDELGATGWGLLHAIEVAAPVAGITLDGARIVVQGFGAVGMHAARFLVDRGALLVAASDSRGAIANEKGLDLEQLIAHKRSGGGVASFAGGRAVDDIVAIECEVWIPAARPDVITADNVGQLRTRIVAQGANIPASAEAERQLTERGVLNLPDFIANAGGVICAAMEYAGATEAQAFDSIAEKIRANTAEVLERARRDGTATRAAAVAMAEERVRSAMATRRFSIF